MIRFTWLQFRTQAAVVFGALAVLAVVLAVTGWHLARLYDTTAAACKARGDCAAAMNAFASNDGGLQSFVKILLLAAPALIGMFWGAPLIAREFETGTFRLAWTQDVTPTRWLAIKLGVVGLASVAAAGLLSLMVTWWSSPIDKAFMDQWGVFNLRDITPVGYAAFAFALGVTAGMLIRRTVPAMAITLAVFAAAQVVMGLYIRPPPHHAGPHHLAAQYRGAPGNRGDGERPPASGRAPEHAWRLGLLQPDRHPGRPSGLQRTGYPALHDGLRPGVRRLHRQASPPAVSDVSARQPLLGLPVVRNGDLPRSGRHPGRSLLLADPPPSL